jgi:hypothetical protein
MTTQILIAVFTILLTLSLAVERLIEVARPLIEKIAVVWQPSVKIGLAVVIGFGLAALFRFDLLKELLVFGVAPVLGYLLAGLVASTGSSVIHPILEWLKSLKNDTTTTVTTISEEDSKIRTNETTVIKSQSTTEDAAQIAAVATMSVADAKAGEGTVDQG